MKAGTLFSGIGAPECAAPGIDWRWAAEIDPFACAVHKARFPHIPNLGDILEIDWHATEPVDLVVGGPPCQDYSVAGQRASLSGARGDLTLQYAHALNAIDPAWSVTENVPGWLSTPDNAFGTFLGILVGNIAPLVPGRGQRWTDAGVVAGPRRTAAWRILDAQHCGVPQRRRRVFVVAVRGAGNFACAAALFPVGEGVRRDTETRRAAGERTAYELAPCIGASGRGFERTGDPRGQDCLIAFYKNMGSHGGGAYQDVSPTIKHGGHDTNLPAVAFGGNNTAGPIDVATACNAHGGPHGRLDFESETFVIPRGGPEPERCVSPASRAKPAASDAGAAGGRTAGSTPATGASYGEDGTGRGTPLIVGTIGAESVRHTAGTKAEADLLVAVGFHENQRAETYLSDVMHSLKCGGGKPGQGYPAVLFDPTARQPEWSVGRPLKTDGPFAVLQYGAENYKKYTAAMSVRRLTPKECARLMGFPDNWCAIEYRGKPAADGPMYRAYGNSMAVPCVGWVLARVQQAHAAASVTAEAAA